MKKLLTAGLSIALIAMAFMSQPALANDGQGKDNNNNNRGKLENRMKGKDFRAGFFFNIFNREKEDKTMDNNDNDQEINDDNAITTHNSNKDHADNFRGFRGGVAKVTAVSGSTITATNLFGSNGKTWTINTDGNTSFILRNGNSTTLSNVNVGDTISFMGTFTSKDDSHVVIDASKVRVWGDVDLQAKANVTGTVTSVDDSNSQLTLKTDTNEIITINASDLTRIKDANGSSTTFANIDAGSNVQVKGFWNTLKNIITAIRIKLL